MQNFDISVPVQYRFLSQWTDLLNKLPQQGKYILNKVNAGCGGTTLFLSSDKPCILVSPRSNVLYSKADQFPNAHLFRKKTDISTSPVKLKERLRQYIDMLRITSIGKCGIVPKILVTIDSYQYVAEQLAFMGILSDFTVLVDEFHCVLGDSKYKGKVDLEFLHNLCGVKSVCYMSATPIPEIYLNAIPEFSDVSCYYRLVWDPSVKEDSNALMVPYKPKQSSKSICREIIEKYRKDGFFATKIVGGNIVYSKEVVIFLNDVRTIVQIIKENMLDTDQVNVLCSTGNKYVKDLKMLNVHIGELCTDRNNPYNRVFTFATRASFEGVDFYSNNAFTYIFCDGVLDWNKNDLIIDVPQILGRQRLASNPFWKDAKVYYRPNSKAGCDEKIKRIKDKEDNTTLWIQKFNVSDDLTKVMLKDGIDKRSSDLRYADDYVEFVDNLNGGYTLKENSLVKAVELRDYELSAYVYNSPISILKNMIDNSGINVTSIYGYNTTDNSDILTKFKHDFFKNSTFPDKMRIYSDMRQQHPELSERLYENPFIDIRYHSYYDILGADRIRALRYREKEISEAADTYITEQKIQSACSQLFVPGTYKSADVKQMLQDIYNRLGVSATAKASDILRFCPSAQRRQLTTLSTQKREIYYEIK